MISLVEIHNIFIRGFALRFSLLVCFSIVACSTNPKVEKPNSIEAYLYDLDFKSPTEIQLKIKDCEMSCASADADLARTLTDVLKLEERVRAEPVKKVVTKTKHGKKKQMAQSSSSNADLKEQMQVIQVYSAKLAPLCARFREAYRNKSAALNWSAGLCSPFIDQTEKERFLSELLSFRGKQEQDVALTYRMARYALESGKPYLEIEALVNECLKMDSTSTDCKSLMALVKDKFWKLECSGNDLESSFRYLPISDRQNKNLSKTLITDDRVLFGDPANEFSSKQISAVVFSKMNHAYSVEIKFYTNSKSDLTKQLKKAGSKWGMIVQNQVSILGSKLKLESGSMLIQASANQSKLESEFKKICTKH